MAASLRDENQRLRVQLKNCDLNYQRAERQVADLLSRMCQAEAEAARHLRLKEAEWMAEYDRSVQALLKIVLHHEDENIQLRAEVEQLRELAATISPSITKMTRSTQTETSKEVPKRNSVTFAKDNCEAVSNKEEVFFVDIKTKKSFARMQRLFEQLQVPRNQRSRDQSTELVRDASDRCIPDPTCSFKATILKRLKDNQSAHSTQHRRHTEVTLAEESKRKMIETQTDEVPIPKLETSSGTPQQDLEERNRLLNERLVSQQKILDQLLLTKLKQASDDNGATYTPCNISQVCVVDGQGEEDGHFVPSTIPEESLLVAQNDDMRSESAGRVEQRPLSPPAA